MNRKYTRSKRKKDKLAMTSHFEKDALSCHLPIHLQHHINGIRMPLPMSLFNDVIGEDCERNQPPLTHRLETLLRSVSPKHEYYVYDVYYYETERDRCKKLPDKTLNTLRIGVISPLLLGTPQQSRDVLEWAVKRELLPANWEKPDYSQGHVSDSLRTTADIADTFVQCLLRTDVQNLVKISYHIGEWYNFSRKEASHEMNRDYRLDGLKRDLQEMYLLQSIWCIYTEVPKELVWYIAVFVCHQYFFYLADSEYKSHTLLREVEYGLEDKDALQLKDEGNDCHNAEKYYEAIQKYTAAIEICPYNHLLYSNRAISYLKLKDAKYSDKHGLATKCALSAMSDAFRCIKLDPLYAKGHDRYASALIALDERGQAIKALEGAIQNMEQRKADKKSIKDLKLRLEQYSGVKKPTKQKADCEGGTNGSTTHDNKSNGDSNDSSTMLANDIAALEKDTKSLADDFRNLAKENSSMVIRKPHKDSKLASNDSEVELLFIETGGTISKKIKTEPKSTPMISTNGKAKDSSTATTNGKAMDSSTATKKSEGAVSSKADRRNSHSEVKVNGSTSKGTKGFQKNKLKAASKKTSVTEDEQIATGMAEIKELERTIKSGSEALIQKKYRFAINLYEKCFKLIQQSTVMKVEAGERLLELRYARCVAYIYAGPNEDILLGIKELKKVLESQPSLTMKAITLYELGTAYAKQHRYEEAIGPVKESLKLCESKKGLRNPYCWPGTDTFIEHSDQSVLQVKLNRLLNECKNPPQPDFICLSELCTSYSHLSSAIYIDDPDFRGFVCILCTEKCLLHYHRDCWKKKHLKVNGACVTPDCDGHIQKISEYDEHVQKVQEEKSDVKYSKPQKKKKKVQKQKLSSLVRIAEKQRKKEEKRAKRAERNNAVAEVTEEVDLADKILSAADKAEDDKSPAADLRTSNFVIKHKKHEEELEEKPAARKPGKRVKTKQVMSLEEFCGVPTVDDTGSNMSSGSIPLPPQLREDTGRFITDYHTESLPVVIQGVSVEKLKETVQEFYYDMLEADGPKRADSAELLNFLEYEQAARELIQHCDGLTNFLLSTNRFVLIEGIICIKRDSDIQKAQEMVDSLKNVPYGVGVVQNDFKEQVSAASSFKPKRKLYSGYDEVVQDFHTPSHNTTEHWQLVVQDWNQSERAADEISLEERERSGSCSTGVSEQEVEKTERPLVVVEQISPALKQDWKNYQDQKLMDSLTVRTEKESASPKPTVISDNDQLAFPQPEPWTVSSNADASDQLAFATQSVSVDSLAAERNTNSVNSNLDVDDSTDIRAKVFGTQFNSTSPPLSLPKSVSPPNLSGSEPYIPPTPFIPNIYAPTISRPSIAPIGTPYPYFNNNFAVPPMPSRPIPADYSRGFNQGASWNTPGARPIHPESNMWPLTANLSASTQTEQSTSDRSTNTEYYEMDDYDKKDEECRGLQQRNEELSDKLQRLKQGSSTTIDDLRRRLTDALDSEKETRVKSEKIQQQVEKETKKWKEEKKAWTDEMNSQRKLCNESRWKAEQSESKLKQLEENFNGQKRSHNDTLEEKEAAIRQYQARLELMEKQWIEAQVEVINERERLALNELEEMLATTNKSIALQRDQVQRLLQNGSGALPPIVMKNAELSNQRRERLLAVKREQESLYESHREAIRFGTIPWTKIPRTSPPSLMEIVNSTSLPRPPPTMVPMRSPMAVPVNPQMMQRMRGPVMQQQQQGPEQPPMVNAHGDGAPSKDNAAPDKTPETTPTKGQMTKRNVEIQLIQDIQSIFPNLSGDDIKAYIGKLRETRQGLTGLTFAELKRHTIELVLQTNGQHAKGSAPAAAEECAICTEKLINAPVRKLHCEHIFHDQCIGNWLTRQKNCPVCRRPTA